MAFAIKEFIIHNGITHRGPQCILLAVNMCGSSLSTLTGTPLGQGQALRSLLFVKTCNGFSAHCTCRENRVDPKWILSTFAIAFL